MSTGPTIAAIAIGANLGDRAGAVRAALAEIRRLPGTVVVAAAEPIETEPVGPIPQPRYLNSAVVVRTTLTARELLRGLLEIERSLGRDRAREQRWGPRTLDLDLLVFGEEIIDEPGLTVPHPRLHERLFALEPLAAIAPEMVVPTRGATVAQLRARLRGTPAAPSGSN